MRQYTRDSIRCSRKRARSWAWGTSLLFGFIMGRHGVCGQCPDGWSAAASGKCFRLVPDPYHGLRGDALPAFSECPALCGPNAALACLESTEDLLFVAESLLCRGPEKEWRIPWHLDTALPEPGHCIAAFLGAYSRSMPANGDCVWCRDVDWLPRDWQCGPGAGSYNVSKVWPQKYGARGARAWNRVDAYGMVGPLRLSMLLSKPYPLAGGQWWPSTPVWYDWSRKWYDHRGNVTMVFSEHAMKVALSASATQRLNSATPHAPCLCEHIAGGADRQAASTGQAELQALIESNPCSPDATVYAHDFAARFQCGRGRLVVLAGAFLLAPVLLGMCYAGVSSYRLHALTAQDALTAQESGRQHSSGGRASSSQDRGREDTATEAIELNVYVAPLVGAVRAHYTQRVKVSGTLVLLGWVLLLVALLPSLMTADQLWVAEVMGNNNYYLSLLPWGATLLGLAVRPVDATTIRGLQAIVLVLCTFFSLACFNTAVGAYCCGWYRGTCNRECGNHGRMVGYFTSSVLLMVAVWVVLPRTRCNRCGCFSRVVCSCGGQSANSPQQHERHLQWSAATRPSALTPRALLGRVWLAIRLVQLSLLVLAWAEVIDLMNVAVLWRKRDGVGSLWPTVLTTLQCALSGRWYAWAWGGNARWYPQAGAWYWQPTRDCYVSYNIRQFASLPQVNASLYPDSDQHTPLRVSADGLAKVVYSVSCMLCFLVSHRENRRRVLHTLHRLLSPSEVEGRAASLAALLGSANPAQALGSAQHSLRALPLSRFTASIFDQHDPARRLSHARPPHGVMRGAAERHRVSRSSHSTSPVRSQPFHPEDEGEGESIVRPCAFGEIDAFVSHAWLDSVEAKLYHLTQWFAAQERAVAGPGTEPLIWIDVACINRFDIVRDLQCLPFYILASKQFVGLVGQHFPNRLWCIVEVFLLFELRRGQTEPCVFVDLCAEQEDYRPERESRFFAFDANLAQCASAEDRDHVLAILESCFGSLQHFNRIVRSLKLSRVGAREAPSNGS